MAVIASGAVFPASIIFMIFFDGGKQASSSVCENNKDEDIKDNTTNKKSSLIIKNEFFKFSIDKKTKIIPNMLYRLKVYKVTVLNEHYFSLIAWNFLLLNFQKNQYILITVAINIINQILM